MERIGIRELRQNASRYLEKVKAGQTVEVTDRGVLVALIVPPTPSQTAYERLVAVGHLVPASRPWQTPQPVEPPPGSPSTETVLDELRAERL